MAIMHIHAPPLPPDSLLARHRGPECYRDAFCATVSQPVSLAQFIAAFYGSRAFMPEGWVLSAIGHGPKRGDIPALAQGRIERFAAWTVEARTPDEILLRDITDDTCSWLKAEPGDDHTTLWFGSGLRRPNRIVVRALTPAHRFYARLLLRGAIGMLGTPPR